MSGIAGWVAGGPMHGQWVEVSGSVFRCPVPERPEARSWGALAAGCSPAQLLGEPPIVRYTAYRMWRKPHCGRRDLYWVWVVEHHNPQAERWEGSWPNLALCECTAQFLKGAV